MVGPSHLEVQTLTVKGEVRAKEAKEVAGKEEKEVAGKEVNVPRLDFLQHAYWPALKTKLVMCREL